MPDAKAGSFATFASEEFINSSRTIAYIQNYGLPITVDGDCWCPQIQQILDLDCDSVSAVTGYQFPSNNYPADSTPAGDPAPWYDPAIPESGDFLGFLPAEFEGLGSTYTRQVIPTVSDGVLGRLKAQPRTLTWRGYLFGRTCCAAEFGLRWLTARLAEGGGCGGGSCDGTDMDILLCCPEVTGIVSEDDSACSSYESPSLGQSCKVPDVPPLGASNYTDAFRTFRRVGLVDGPRRLSERTIGCGNCEDGPGCLIEVEFTLVAATPYMYKEPVLVCGPTNFPECDDCIEWVKVTTAEECENLLACDQAESDCAVDPNCPLAELPTIPPFQDDCGCDPIAFAQICCAISNDIYGQFFEGIPQIKVFSGSQPLRNVTISFFENPQERTCDDEDLFDICNLCDTVTIRYIPANSTMTLDGLTKTVNVECPGNNVQPGESLLVSSYNWPILKCFDYIVTVKADCCAQDPIEDPDCTLGIAPNANVTICVIPREM